MQCGIFLDSGAYSARSLGVPVNLDEYIAFIKEYHEYIEVYPNLDVIGDAEATWENQKIMEAAGLHPIPCYHYGEDFKYLERYVQYPYMALGGMVGASKPTIFAWLDVCWKIICDTPERLPKCKVHGFGMTSVDFILRYPWWSIDSTSWLAKGRFGGIYVPREGSYLKPPLEIDVSTRAPTQKQVNQHLSTVSPLERTTILKYIADNGFHLGRSILKAVALDYKLESNERWYNDTWKGGDIEVIDSETDEEIRWVEIIEEVGLCNNHILRDHFNFMYFRNLEKAMPPWPQPFKEKRVYKPFGLL